MNSLIMLLSVIGFTVLHLLLEKLMRKILKIKDVDTTIIEKRARNRGFIFILISYLIIRSFFFRDDDVIITVIFGFICIGFDIFAEWKYSEESKGYVAPLIAGSITGIVLVISYFLYF